MSPVLFKKVTYYGIVFLLSLIIYYFISGHAFLAVVLGLPSAYAAYLILESLKIQGDINLIFHCNKPNLKQNGKVALSGVLLPKKDSVLVSSITGQECIYFRYVVYGKSREQFVDQSRYIYTTDMWGYHVIPCDLHNSSYKINISSIFSLPENSKKLFKYDDSTHNLYSNMHRYISDVEMELSENKDYRYLLQDKEILNDNSGHIHYDCKTHNKEFDLRDDDLEEETLPINTPVVLIGYWDTDKQTLFGIDEDGVDKIKVYFKTKQEILLKLRYKVKSLYQKGAGILFLSLFLSIIIRVTIAI